MIALWLLAACGGPSEETLLDELRVVAVVAEPPEAGPAEVVDLSVYVADPAEEGARVAAWSCVLTGETCLEGTTTEVQDWVVTDTLDPGEELSISLTVPAALAGILSEKTPELPVLMWVLACAPGICDDTMDELETGADLGSPVSDYYNERLASPLDWIDELPGTGSTLALTTLTVSNRAPEERNANPVLTADFDTVGTAGDTGLELPFLVDDDPEQELIVYGFTTLGAFDMPQEVADGEVTLTLYADGQQGDAELFVIAQDDAGGVAVWQGEGELNGEAE